jgi:hypothetical protein
MRRASRLVGSLLALVVASLFISSRLGSEADGADEAPPTFSKEVVRIFQARCQSCHHPADIAPFSMMTYADVLPELGLIRSQTLSREMPPWKARPTCDYGFVGDTSLSQEEIDTVVKWVDAGAPEGDPADLPAPLAFDDGWQLGEPDVVLANAKRGFRLPKDLQDDLFQCFSITTGFKNDHWITAMEIKPGTRGTVHHVLLFLDTDSVSAELDRKYPGPGYECIGGAGFDADVILSWNPGAPPVTFPDGVGIRIPGRIPAGGRIVMQVHYGEGYAGKLDKTLVGLHFAKSPVVQERRVIQPRNQDFTIPAGAPNHLVTASVTLLHDMTADTVTPHMHRLGTDIKVDAILPGGVTRCLADVEWDVHWQGTFVFEEPVPLPAGTEIRLSGWYDNSESNPLNPHTPPRDVVWGRQSYNEMLFAFIGVTQDDERRTPSAPSLSSVRAAGSRLVAYGTGFHGGACLEVDGRLLMDTKFDARRGMCGSAKTWRSAVRRGAEVGVAVVNPDGGRTATMTFRRR